MSSYIIESSTFFLGAPEEKFEVFDTKRYNFVISEIPKLPPIQKEEEIVQEELIEEEVEESDVIDNREPPKQAQPKKVSRPKKANPYDEQSAQYWPIIISIGVLLPTVVILCKLGRSSYYTALVL